MTDGMRTQEDDEVTVCGLSIERKQRLKNETGGIDG